MFDLDGRGTRETFIISRKAIYERTDAAGAGRDCTLLCLPESYAVVPVSLMNVLPTSRDLAPHGNTPYIEIHSPRA
ncbi:unnamed protein product, partial [Nesidiocoris tenuis]